MCQIFIADSIDFTLDQKIRKKGKAKEYEKELQEYDIKMQEVVEEYKLLFEKEKDIVFKIRYHCRELGQSKAEILLKVKLHLNTYCTNFEDQVCTCYQEFVFSKLEQRDDKLLVKLNDHKLGFV